MPGNNELICELIYVPYKEAPILYTHLWTENMTVADLIHAAGLAQARPEIKALTVGIFARRVTWDTILKPGDRVEVYRPLQIDPKEKRRRKAKSN